MVPKSVTTNCKNTGRLTESVAILPRQLGESSCSIQFEWMSTFRRTCPRTRRMPSKQRNATTRRNFSVTGAVPIFARQAVPVACNPWEFGMLWPGGVPARVIVHEDLIQSLNLRVAFSPSQAADEGHPVFTGFSAQRSPLSSTPPANLRSPIRCLSPP
jgi:hypothetical protein